MPVSVQCYHCSTVLELDEGFRGGVCRCSRCGSLLQVPKAANRNTQRAGRPAAPEGNGTVRPENPLADPGLSRGQLDVRSPNVGSSGAFSRSPAGRPAGPPVAATARAPAAPAKKPVAVPQKADGRKKKKRNLTAFYLLIGAGLVLLATCVLVVLLVFSHGRRPQGAAAGAGGGINTGPAVHALSGPRVLGLALTGKHIVFSLDDSTSTIDSFSFIANGVRLAVHTLAPDQRFRIALWTGHGVELLPKSGFTSARRAGPTLRKLVNMEAGGATDIEKAMLNSLKLRANQVVFITAKNYFPQALANKIIKARKAGERLDVIYVNDALTPTPLSRIAADGNGRFLRLTEDNLQRLVEHR